MLAYKIFRAWTFSREGGVKANSEWKAKLRGGLARGTHREIKCASGKARKEAVRVTAMVINGGAELLREQRFLPSGFPGEVREEQEESRSAPYRPMARAVPARITHG